MNILDLEEGQVFSEISHYTFIKEENGKYVFKHHASQEDVELTEKYVTQLLSSAHIYSSEQKVGKLDKFWTEKQITAARNKGEIDDTVQVGDLRVPGIRTLFEGIHSQTVFSVCFKKKDTKMSNKAYSTALEIQRNEALAAIEKASRQKKGVANKAIEVITNLQNNPILPIVEGESRILTGFKTQFSSVDGSYQCMDMVKNQPRPVNINTIEWLIFNDVKYIVE